MTDIGTDLTTGDTIALSPEDRTRHLLILGKTGTGKSNLMLSMIRQDVDAGHGFCLIDPFGELTNKVLTHIPRERMGDVVLLDLSDTDWPFGINIFETGTRPADVTALFQKVWGNNWGTLVQKWLSAVTHTFADAGEGTLADLPRLFSDTTYRTRILTKLRNPQAKVDWLRATKRDGTISQEECGSTLNRISLFLYDEVLANVVGQQRSTVDFAEFVRQGYIVLCKLGAQNKETQGIIGTLIIQRLTQALIGTYRDRPYFVYCDEFQRFATPDMVDLITGGRQFGVGMTLATQSLAQIKDAFIRENLPNVGSTIAFTLPIDDASLVARSLTKKPGRDAQTFRPDPYQALLRDQHPNTVLCDRMRWVEGWVKQTSTKTEVNRSGEFHISANRLFLRYEHGDTDNMSGIIDLVNDINFGKRKNVILLQVPDAEEIAAIKRHFARTDRDAGNSQPS